MSSVRAEYLVNGVRHRADGPAIISKITPALTAWCLYGKPHRYYGSQNVHNIWWIHGKVVKW